MADLVGMLTSGTEAMRGLNILIPVAAVAFFGLAGAVMEGNGAIGIINLLTGGALPAVLAVVRLIVGAVTAVVGSVRQATESEDSCAACPGSA